MKSKNNFSVVLLILMSAFFTTFAETANAVGNSNNWDRLLEKRSSSIFTESIDLGGLRVGGRGQITFTWLDRGLQKALDMDKDTYEAIISGLAYYHIKKPEVVKLLKNRDVFLLSYQAVKRWDFKIEEIVINGYRLTTDDILTPTYDRVLGEIPPRRTLEKLIEEDGDLDDYRLHVAVPSMPRSGFVILSYGDDTVEWEIPSQ